MRKVNLLAYQFDHIFQSCHIRSERSGVYLIYM
jgi:hypothetical protein